MLRRLLAVLLAAAIGFASGVAAAMPTGFLGKVEGDLWTDKHQGYPSVPNGRAAIEKVFGSPCSSDANANSYLFVAQDDNKPYQVNFHRKLGGTASSNLDNDIPGHLHADGHDAKLKRGIWGFVCRKKRNSNEYSVHAWGVAVDINSAYEAPGKDCNTISNAHGGVWTEHRWYWGKAWKDCMHFQYATGY